MLNPTPIKQSTFLSTLLFNLIVLTAGLLLIELFFGGWIGKNDIQNLNVLKNVSFRMKISHLYPSSNDFITYTRDAYGLRGDYGSPEKVDVLTIGGSTTDQRYLADDLTWQQIFEKNFKKNDRKLLVANAGQDGQSAVGLISDFKWWFPKIPGLKPRYVLVYTGINDLFTSANADDLTGAESFKARIKAKSILYTLYQKLRGTWQAMLHLPLSHRSIDFGKEEWTTMPLHPNHDLLIQERLGTYKKRLLILDEKIKALGAKAIFMTQPTHFIRTTGGQKEGVVKTLPFEGSELNGLDVDQMMELINETTMALCKSNQDICLDLAHDVMFEDADFYDYTHNTPPGAQKIGDYLYQHLSTIIHP